MGYTLDAYGKPVFDDSFNLPDDVQAGVDFADAFANIRRGTSAERQALTPGKIRDSILFAETDTGDLHMWRGAGWELVLGDTGWLPLGTLSTGWSIQNPDQAGYRVKNGLLYFRGRLNATAGAGTSLLTTPLPTTARPTQDTASLVGLTGGSGASYVVSVTTLGQIVIYKGSSSILNLPLNGVPPVVIG